MKLNRSGISGALRSDKFNQILYVLPAFIIFGVFYAYPTGTSLYYSFTDWNGISQTWNYIGFDNYLQMFSNAAIFLTIPTTFYFALLNTVLLSFIGFIAALALNRESRFTNILRGTFFLPMLVSGIIVGFVFKELYSPVMNEETMGTINLILTKLGLSVLRQNWLGNPNTAMLVVVLTGVWNQVGTTALIYLAGMQSISKELYEAAKIDGAGYWRQTYFITWKMIAPALTINMIFLLINSLKAYDMIAILTQGGPGTATKVINIAILNYSIGGYKVGLGAAMSMVVTVFVFVVVTALNRILRKREVQL